jgi:hypothetical protein
LEPNTASRDIWGRPIDGFLLGNGAGERLESPTDFFDPRLSCSCDGSLKREAI